MSLTEYTLKQVDSGWSNKPGKRHFKSVLLLAWFFFFPRCFQPTPKYLNKVTEYSSYNFLHIILKKLHVFWLLMRALWSTDYIFLGSSIESKCRAKAVLFSWSLWSLKVVGLYLPLIVSQWHSLLDQLLDFYPSPS